ncbi:MAG: hypothetical protein ACFFCS_26090 [Candidatus Hodarchaeota archaeon]
MNEKTKKTIIPIPTRVIHVIVGITVISSCMIGFFGQSFNYLNLLTLNGILLLVFGLGRISTGFLDTSLDESSRGLQVIIGAFSVILALLGMNLFPVPPSVSYTYVYFFSFGLLFLGGGRIIMGLKGTRNGIRISKNRTKFFIVIGSCSLIIGLLVNILIFLKFEVLLNMLLVGFFFNGIERSYLGIRGASLAKSRRIVKKIALQKQRKEKTR